MSCETKKQKKSKGNKKENKIAKTRDAKSQNTSETRNRELD